MSASPVAERFKRNIRGFFAAHRWLLGLFAVALLADAGSTIYFMTDEGAEHEVHPAVRIVSHIAGPIIGPILGAIAKGAAALVVAIYLRRWAWLILLVGSTLSLWASWYNVWGADLYVPRLLRFIPW